VVDAESFFVRNTTVQEVVASYLKDPHLIVSSRKRYEDQQDMATRRAVGIAEVRLFEASAMPTHYPQRAIRTR
jgi:hypothetical protein